MTLSTSALSVKLAQLSVDNATYDLVLGLKAALGQKFVLRNTDNGSDLLSVSATAVNAHSKPLIGVSASNDATSAVPLSTLQAYQP